MDANPDTLILGLGWYFVFVFSTCLHEAAHAWAAHHLGDSTAFHGGQVTLNPWPHMRREPIGMILFPIISFFSQGWMMGWASAPYDPRWALTYPKRAALMALAGPAANLLLVLTAGFWMRVGIFFRFFNPPLFFPYWGHAEFPPFDGVVTSAHEGGPAAALAMILSIFFMLNLILFVLNLIPLPPLDGSAVAMLFLDDSTARRYMGFLYQSGIGLIGLLIAWHFFPKVFDPVGMFFLKILYAGIPAS